MASYQTPSIGVYPPPSPALTDRSSRTTCGSEWEVVASSVSNDEKVTQLLDIIDEIREHDVQEKLSLPQIVVCGSQSSGKSSVLEGLARIPFPRGSSTCTRFVTEIRLIRDKTLPEPIVKVDIIPKESHTAETKAALDLFWRQFAERSLSPRDVEGVITAAASAMGLSNQPRGSGKMFSRDILRITVRGPRFQRLTLVDLPGIIANDRASGANDMKTVQEITHEYISQRQSIILPIVSANQDPQNWPILQLARDADPDGKRTFTVITKPDLTEAGHSLETDWVDIAMQRHESPNYQFQKGCHVVLNRDADEVKIGTEAPARDSKEEDFFRSVTYQFGKNIGKRNGWHEVYGQGFWGVRNLMPRLNELLYQHTVKELPFLQREIIHIIDDHDARLKNLGFVLDPDKMRQGLLKETRKISQLIDHGAQGTYRDTTFFSLSAPQRRKLRSNVVREIDQFCKNLETGGHAPEYASLPGERVHAENKDIEEFYNVLQAMRGTELPGHYDPFRMTQLFVEYSKNWHKMANDCLARIRDHLKAFLREVLYYRLEAQFPELSERLWEYVLDARLDEQLNAAKEELDKLEGDRGRAAATQNPMFWESASRKYSDRLHNMFNAVEKGFTSEELIGGATFFCNSPETFWLTLGFNDHDTYLREGAARMMNEMLIYYKIARYRYIDNVMIQVVERHLLADLPDILDQQWVYDPETFSRVTFDPGHEERQKKRTDLEQGRKKLKDCLTKLDRIRMED